MLPTELCAGTGQEDGWLRVNQLRGVCNQPCQCGQLWGSVPVLFRDRPSTASRPLLLLWEVKIIAFAAICACCEYKCVKLYEVLR